MQVEVLVTVNQRVEQKFVDPLRLRIEANPRVKIRRTALDDHHQRVHVSRFRARKERNEQRDENKKSQATHRRSCPGLLVCGPRSRRAGYSDADSKSHRPARQKLSPPSLPPELQSRHSSAGASPAA